MEKFIAVSRGIMRDDIRLYYSFEEFMNDDIIYDAVYKIMSDEEIEKEILNEKSKDNSRQR